MMFRILILWLILFSQSFAFAFDETILWRYELPSPKNSLSVSPSNLTEVKLRTQALHTKPYNIDKTGWNNIVIAYGSGGWGSYFRLTSYDIEELYVRRSTDIGYGRVINNNLCMSTELRFVQEEFRHDYTYKGIELNLSSSYTSGPLIANIGINGIPVEKIYTQRQFNRPSASISFVANNKMIYTVALKKQSNGFTRWHFAQNGQLTKQVDFNLGYINNPGTLYAGLDFLIKNVKLNVSYFGVSRLNNSIVVGIGYFQ